MIKTTIYYTIAAIMSLMLVGPAFAGVTLSHNEPVFKQEPITETVRVCHKTKDRTTQGAIIGGLIGSQDGNAGIGALIGGILGDAAGGHTECRDETRTIGYRDILVGYNVHLVVDGMNTVVYVPR